MMHGGRTAKPIMTWLIYVWCVWWLIVYSASMLKWSNCVMLLLCTIICCLINDDAWWLDSPVGKSLHHTFIHLLQAQSFCCFLLQSWHSKTFLMNLWTLRRPYSLWRTNVKAKSNYWTFLAKLIQEKLALCDSYSGASLCEVGFAYSGNMPDLNTGYTVAIAWMLLRHCVYSFWRWVGRNANSAWWFNSLETEVCSDTMSPLSCGQLDSLAFKSLWPNWG